MNTIKLWIKKILSENRTSSTGPGPRSLYGDKAPKIAKSVLIPG